MPEPGDVRRATEVVLGRIRKPAFVNVHTNIAPLVGAFLLLFPGVIVALPLNALTVYVQAVVIGRRLFSSP